MTHVKSPRLDEELILSISDSGELVIPPFGQVVTAKTTSIQDVIITPHRQSDHVDLLVMHDSQFLVCLRFSKANNTACINEKAGDPQAVVIRSNAHEAALEGSTSHLITLETIVHYLKNENLVR